MKLSRILAMTSALAFAAFLTVGCSEKGPAERTGAEIDRAVEDARDATKDALDSAKDAAEDAADSVKDAAEDAVKAGEEALEDAKDAVHDATQ